MNVIIEARDDMISKLKKLEPGSTELLQQTKAIQIMSSIDREDKVLEFDREKEETRKLEKSNEYLHSETTNELKKIDLAIHALDVILNPGTRLLGLILNNRTRVRRDKMGYEFEENGVIGSHTFVNSQKDKYD